MPKEKLSLVDHIIGISFIVMMVVIPIACYMLDKDVDKDHHCTVSKGGIEVFNGLCKSIITDNIKDNTVLTVVGARSSILLKFSTTEKVEFFVK